MTKLLGVILAVFAATSQQAPVALKASIRLTIARSEAPFDGPASPYDNFGPLVSKLVTPDGPVDIQYLIAPDQSRAELRGRLATLNGGTVVLERAGDEMLRVVNAENKTWYEIPAGENPGAALGTPDVDIEPTTDVATIAGETAKRFVFTETLHVPPPQGAALPPDFPADLRLTGDLWTTDAFAGSGYAGVIKTLQAFAAIPGIDALTAGGRFPLRLILRSNVMPGYEIRSEVTAIRQVPVDPGAFAVPAGYLHVVPPGR
jgi:hypothetical protein